MRNYYKNNRMYSFWYTLRPMRIAAHLSAQTTCFCRRNKQTVVSINITFSISIVRTTTIGLCSNHDDRMTIMGRTVR